MLRAGVRTFANRRSHPVPRPFGTASPTMPRARQSPLPALPAMPRTAATLWRAAGAGVALRLRGQAEVLPDFVSPAEETALARELEPQLRRRQYQFDHWDGAIHGFRETEKSHWSAQCQQILERVRAAALPPNAPHLGPVHVLDLDKNGYIKPHVDSVKFCGCTIAGLSLLSASVMRLVSEENPKDWLDMLLPPCSLYILRGPARYNFTHEILRDEDSFFNGQRVPRNRRISLICRSLPLPPLT